MCRYLYFDLTALIQRRFSASMLWRCRVCVEECTVQTVWACPKRTDTDSLGINRLHHRHQRIVLEKVASLFHSHDEWRHPMRGEFPVSSGAIRVFLERPGSLFQLIGGFCPVEIFVCSHNGWCAGTAASRREIWTNSDVRLGNKWRMKHQGGIS